MKFIRSFVKGKMNKSVDERLVPDGEYVDALNVRVGSTETTDIGALENTKGNTQITTLQYPINGGQNLSADAVCIGAFEDGAEETIYWFVHDPNSPAPGVDKVDLIVSYNFLNSTLNYIATAEATGSNNTALNFNPTYLINGINKIEDFLFFTDNYNAPRRIDVTETYLGLTEDTNLLVIKKPPLFAPTIELQNINKEINYIEDKFITFAYRWKYKTGEYSSLSPFSQIAFDPQNFRLNGNNFTNDGMLNRYNSVKVTVDGDAANEVEEIQVCFKFGDETVIKVAEEIDIDPNQTTYSIDFDNSKNYTVLPQSEILRLFDNVPRLAKAQTLMGNRIMYGNYLEGYDLSRNGQPTELLYEANLITENINLTEYAVEQIAIRTNSSMLSGATNIPVNQTGQVIYFDLTGFSMVAGSILNINIDIEHSGWYVFNTPPVGLAAYPTNIGSGSFQISLQYTLPQYYATVFDLVTSAGFLQAIGVAGSIQPLNSCSQGQSLTDVFNCNINTTPTADWAAFESGFATTQQPIETIFPTALQPNVFGLRILSVNFLDVAGVSLAPTLGELFQITSGEVYSTTEDSLRSLHSDRNYEVAIEYLDDFGRASTALVSPFNSVYVPCSAMTKQNKVQVRIPVGQAAPDWATHYRFLMKPDRDQYQTIYATNWYDTLQSNNRTWLQLEGENQQKVDAGSFLIPKFDSYGSLGKCCLSEVIDKDVYARNFLSGDDTATPVTLSELPGTYMTIKPECFSTSEVGNETLTFRQLEISSKEIDGKYTEKLSTPSSSDERYLAVNYPLYNEGAAPADIDVWQIEEGALVEIVVEAFREDAGINCGGDCGAMKQSINISYTASQDYADLKQFWEGEGLEAVWNNAPDPNIDCIDDSGPGNTVYYDNLASGVFNVSTGSPIISSAAGSYAAIQGLSQIQFFTITNGGGGDNYLFFRVVSGNRWCENKKKNHLTVDIKITNKRNQIAFETQPSIAIDNLYYEGSDTYQIDADGNHLGIAANGDIDQDIAASTTGIINLSFFNCFSFGNGVESYRILDSIGEQFFLLGSRTNTVIDEEYQAIRRKADITYSGTYQTEQNINRLNEFNLGLANFKSCEQAFGAIQVLDARETDILTLQEDKISYVLAGKNLLSDSTGGGAVTSVPEVLGTQIARVEKYGISENPESYIQWGKEKFFTDAKRGVVLKLQGAGQSEALQIISDTGMDSWFRDLFQESFYTQKLGGYDPYMDEYVLHSNNIQVPIDTPILDCGAVRDIVVAEDNSFIYKIDYGNYVGVTGITYNITAGSVDINISHDGINTTYNNLTGSGTATFNKLNPSPNIATITVSNDAATTAEGTLTFNCTTRIPATVVQLTVNSNEDASKSITNQYSYNFNNLDYPGDSTNLQLSSGEFPIVSQDATRSGFQGEPGIPVHESIVTLVSNKQTTDDFQFDPTQNSLNYYVTNASVPLATVLANMTPAVLDSTEAPNVYKGVTPNLVINSGDYIYLVWDYRSSSEIDLCYDAASAADACCDCTTCVGLYSMSTSTVTADRTTLCPVAAYTETYYYEGKSTGPELDDKVWQDNAQTIPLPGGWYKVSTGDLIYVDDSVSAFSVISLKQTC